MSNYADLIERLQRQRLLSQHNIYALQSEAADAISRLEREKAALVGGMSRCVGTLTGPLEGGNFHLTLEFDDWKARDAVVFALAAMLPSFRTQEQTA